ncbi:hypothetical protein H6P81_005898 [Aristolochia fimbriata]|uniref:Sphingomyelin phosphodiesterase 4 n=1 Tax=Aristolochia fimbriata TaxID=158543 RepID=A0AAV7EX62_ARIFI|nr:hypothetical protein H6P81_005898 [Aristolochia fimbriata]
MESQLKAQELSSIILAASTPTEISAACAAVEDFIRKHVADQMRSFFSVAFPLLIYKIFGFEDASRKSPPSTGWIDQVVASNDGQLASRVFDLLSPSGALFTSILNVDRLALVKYVFPVERVPQWVGLVLQSDKDCRILSDLCPLFKNRLKEDNAQGVCQVQLNVFEYYMFWFAYYPICRGNNENTAEVYCKKRTRFRFESWTSSLPVLASTTRGVGQKAEPKLYLRLLYAYLREFLPSYDVSVYRPYRSSLLHYSPGNDDAILLQAEFVMNTLVHYWLVDNDFSPLPVSLCRSFGVSLPFRMVLGETPPTAGLGEVVKLLVKYINSGSLVEKKVLQEKYDLTERDSGVCNIVKPSRYCETSIRSWSLVMQRSLYRFILRTFLFCPMGSLKNVSEVFSVWIIYLEPWQTATEDFSAFEKWDGQSNSKCKNEQSEVKRSAKKANQNLGCAYTPSWQNYVISNYLFYTSLVVHFLGFAHKFLHTNVETIIEIVLKLLNLLTSSRELVELLKKVDTTYHSKPVGSTSINIFHSSCKYIPTIREQMQDWEDGLSENEADGSFLHEHWNNDLKLFSSGEDGGHHLLKLLILRAEAEIHAVSSDNLPQNLKMLDSLKAQMNYLFDNIDAGNFRSAAPERVLGQPCREEVFTPKHPGFGRRSWADVKYKGDWMRRPISDNEVAWLARLLVKISDWINERLGLDREPCDQEVSYTGWSYLDVPKSDTRDVNGPKEAGWLLLSSLISWILMLVHMALCSMRKYKLRINLRMLGSKKVVSIFVLCTVICSLRRAFGLTLHPPVLLASMMW